MRTRLFLCRKWLWWGTLFSCIRHHTSSFSHLILLIPSNQNAGWMAWLQAIHDISVERMIEESIIINHDGMSWCLTATLLSSLGFSPWSGQLAAVSERVAAASKEGKSMSQEQQWLLFCQLVFCWRTQNLGFDTRLLPSSTVQEYKTYDPPYS